MLVLVDTLRTFPEQDRQPDEQQNADRGTEGEILRGDELRPEGVDDVGSDGEPADQHEDGHQPGRQPHRQHTAAGRRTERGTGRGATDVRPDEDRRRYPDDEQPVHDH